MKKLKLYHSVTYPLSFRIGVFIVGILMVFLFYKAYLALANDGSELLVLSVFGGMYAAADYFADYFMFTGLCHKDAAFRYMQTSFRGKDVFGSIILFDEIHRFLRIVISFGILKLLIVLDGRVDDTTTSFGWLVAALTVYASVSFGLLVLRRISMVQLYSIVMSLFFSMILFITLFVTVAYMGLFAILDLHFSLALLYIVILALLSSLATWLLVRMHVKRFEYSFRG